MEVGGRTWVGGRFGQLHIFSQTFFGFFYSGFFPTPKNCPLVSLRVAGLTCPLASPHTHTRGVPAHTHTRPPHKAAMVILRDCGSQRANNLETRFFEQVTADHYVFSGNGEHGNPEREAIQMLFDARKAEMAQRRAEWSKDGAGRGAGHRGGRKG